MFGLFMNFSRLTDKALREYDAARAELLDYVSPHDGELRISPYLRAIDHMRNCVGAAARAVLNAKALRDNKIGRSGPRLTDRQDQRLAYLRNAIEHSDEKLLGKKHGKSPVFDKVDPYSLREHQHGHRQERADLHRARVDHDQVPQDHRGDPESTHRDTRPGVPQRQAADRPGNPSAQARGDDAVADQQPPRADPADNHPLPTARPSGAPCRAATTPGGAALRDGLGSGHGQGHDQRGEGQRPDDA
jgi:hypothetical protein